MSTAGRFAPMTAELLARKGEARPFNLLSSDNTTIVRRDVVRHIEPSAQAPCFGVAAAAAKTTSVMGLNQKESSAANGASMSAPAAPADPSRFSSSRTLAGKRHSVALLVSDSEFERLGIIAVKTRVNKQQLLRLAIDHYLEKLAKEFRSDCRCISNDGACCSS
jgi:hypothetical protein